MLVVVAASAFVLAFAVWWIAASIQCNNKSGLKGVPNAHFLVPYSRLWLLSLRWRKKENRTRTRLHRRLGPVIRIGPREVSVNCIDDGVRTIYSSKFDKDPSFYHALIDQVGFMVTMIGNDEHRRRRRMMSRPYANSYILNSGNLDKVLSRVTSHLRDTIAAQTDFNTSVDVYQVAKCCTLDVSSGWLFGSENGTATLLDTSFEKDLATLAAAAGKKVSVRTSVDWPMHFLANWIDSKMPDPDATHRWQVWITKVIRNCHKSHPTKPAATASLYDYFYDSFRAANPDMSQNDVASFIAVECDDHLSATHIGLGTVLAYIFYELSRDPASQTKLRKELLSVDETAEQSLPQRLANLPVLDAVVTETLRTRAPCPGPFPRIVPESGCRLVNKYDLPAGTVVSTSAWSLHFNPIPFPSPEQWKPARWLEADPSTVAEMRKWIWTFGSGARVCIGTHFSMRVLKELVFTVYKEFETSLDEEFVGNVDQEDTFSAGPLSNSLKVKFRPLAKN